MARQESSGQKYAQTSDMTQAQSDTLSKLQNNAIHTTQLKGTAQNFLDKASLAMQSVRTIQNKINTSTATLAGNTTITAANRTAIQAAIQDALQTIQNALTSPSADGSYLFGASANPNVAPISDIVHCVSYNPDGTSNTSYAINHTTSNQITVADGVSIASDIDPSDRSISDTIAALQMIRDALAQNVSTIPTSATSLLQTAQSELANFLANSIMTRYNTAQNAIDQIDEIQGQINQSLDAEYSTDQIEVATALANAETAMLENLNILAALMKMPKIWDLLR